MGRKYAVTFSDITVSAAKTLVFIRPPATGVKEIRICKCEIGFKENATSAQCRVQLVTQVTAFPTLTSTTPVALDLGMPASTITGGTAGAAGTSGTAASAEGAGAKTVRYESAFNHLSGWIWVAAPGEEIVLPVASASGFGLYLPDTPGTADGWSGTVIFEEV